MGYDLNRLDEPVFIAVSKPLLTKFGIHLRLESCVQCILTPYMYIRGHDKASLFYTYSKHGIAPGALRYPKIRRKVMCLKFQEGPGLIDLK